MNIGPTEKTGGGSRFVEPGGAVIGNEQGSILSLGWPLSLQASGVLVPFAPLSERLEARLWKVFKPGADFWCPDMFELLKRLEAFFSKLVRLLVVVASFSQTRAPKGAKGQGSQKVGWPNRKEFLECDLRCA